MKSKDIFSESYVPLLALLSIVGLVLFGIGLMHDDNSYTKIDANERVLDDSKINEITYIDEGLYITENENSEGIKQLINGEFEIILDSVQYNCQIIENDFVIVDNQGINWTIYNVYSGDFFIIQSESEPYLGENIYLNKQNNFWGIKDFSGNTILSNVYDGCSFIYDNIVPLQLNGKWGFINDSGIKITDFVFDDFSEPSENKIGIKQNNKWGFINYEGQILLDPIYDDIFFFWDSHCPACKNGKWGFIDNKFNSIVDFDFEEVDYFLKSTTAAKRNKNWGCIDEKGKTVIDFKFKNISQAFNRNENYAVVQLSNSGNNLNVINEMGEVVFSKNYSEIFIMDTPFFLVKRESFIYHLGIILFGISILGFVVIAIAHSFK